MKPDFTKRKLKETKANLQYYFLDSGRKMKEKMRRFKSKCQRMFNPTGILQASKEKSVYSVSSIRL